MVSLSETYSHIANSSFVLPYHHLFPVNFAKYPFYYIFYLLMSVTEDQDNTFDKPHIPFTYLDNQADFDRFASAISIPEQIAVDLEFDDHRFTYGRTVCLIQLAIADQIFLVDSQLIQNLSPLIDWLQNAAIRKVFHSCAADLLILQEVLGCYTKNVEDTSLMYKFVLESDQSISLSRLIKEYVGLKLKKEAQSSDWTKRPLSAKQLTYAATDVFFLFELTHKIKAELVKLGRLSWYEEERLLLEEIRPSESEPYERIAKKAKLTWPEKVILREYWLAFDQLAESLNMPNYKVVSNSRLAELAQNPPSNKTEWMNLKGVHPKVKSPAIAQKMAQLTEELLPRLTEMAEVLKLEKGRGDHYFLSPKEQLQMVKKAEKFDLLKELLEKHQGIGMRTLILPNSTKGQVLKLGLGSLPKWRQQLIKETEKKENLHFSTLWE